MARAPRSDLSDGVGTFHVTVRGVAGMAIFTDDVDRRVFMQMLDRVVTRNRWQLHAYCLMPNHVHLVVQTTTAALSRGMSRLNGGYAQYFNRRQERYGHLFQGRFGATVVDETRQRDVTHYVLENPERAGLGPDYPWAAILTRD